MRQHHITHRPRMPFQCHRLLSHTVVHHRIHIPVQQGQNHLSLWVPKPAIEFQHKHAVLGFHQTGVQYSDIGQLLHDPIHIRLDLCAFFRGENGNRCNRAHPSRVQPGVIVTDTFVILGLGHQVCFMTVAKGHHRHLFADQPFFNHYSVTCRATQFARHHLSDDITCFVQGIG